MAMAEEKFAGWEQTGHLLRSPKDAVHLVTSIQQTEVGEAAQRALIDPARFGSWLVRQAGRLPEDFELPL
jgi:hypothetical protein